MSQTFVRMDPTHLAPEIKIEKQQSSQNLQLSLQKEESYTAADFPQEIKIKLQTKLFHQEKIEPFSNPQNSLHTIPPLSQVEPLNNRPIVLQRRRRNLSHYERFQDVRLVASHFIEYGLNFRKFNQYYPEIDAKFYRNTVEAVNNTAINQIQKFLRYECNIQIEKLNRDQKRSIRTQLTKVRQWLGKRDVGQLQTLFKFIQRKYQLSEVDISLQEALKFYKTILQIVKSPFVDVMEDDIKPQTLDPQVSKQASLQEKQMQEKTLIFLYIQHRNLTKVSDLLCEKFGYTIKWSKHAVKQKIRFLLKYSLKKLIGSVQAYDKQLKLFFSDSQECVDTLVKSEKSMNLKVFLLGFFLQKTIGLIELRQYIRNVNKFFILEYKSHGETPCKKYQQNVKIPKLQIKAHDTEKIICENQTDNKELKITEENGVVKQEKKERSSQTNQKIKLDQKEKPKEIKVKEEYVLVFQEQMSDSDFGENLSDLADIKLYQ